MNGVKPHTELLDVLKKRFPNVGIGSQPENVSTKDSKVVFSGLPGVFTIKPVYISINTVEELKELGGIPDSFYDKVKDTHEMPKMNPEELKNAKSKHPDFCRALSKYVYGNSREVKDYESILNEKRFPASIAFYSGDAIDVYAGHPLEISGPVALSYDTVRMHEGSKIIFEEGNGSLTTNTFSSERQVYIENVGQNGLSGATGAKGTDVNNKNKNGGDGGRGANGASGGTSSDIKVALGDVIGLPVTVKSTGGNGGNGGAGGAGGKNSSSYGGKGGSGGNGGDGGDGGNSGNIYITYKSGDVSNWVVISTGGKGGVGGNGGAGGKGDDGSGSNGSPGKPGNGGSTGSITIEPEK